jgi:hypothetical protein
LLCALSTICCVSVGWAHKLLTAEGGSGTKYDLIFVKEVDVKKPPAKKPITKKLPRIADNAMPLPPQPSRFWNRWTFRVLVVGVVAIVGGGYKVLSHQITCPPGTAICLHGPGLATFDHVWMRGFARDVGIEGGTMSANQSVFEGRATTP